MLELSPWVPILGAPLIAAISGIVVAWINKRRDRADPYAQSQQFIDQLQEDRKVDREDRSRLEGKIDKLYSAIGQLRDYGFAWERWHADGMPDPPGPPKRPEPFA